MNKRAAGFTLLELLIGMLLALITTLAMLTLYRQTARSLFHPEQGSASLAQQDGQLMAALLSVQQQAQEAGFGAAGGRGQNLQLLSLSDLRVDADGTVTALSIAPAASGTANAAAWRYRPSLDANAYACRGVASLGAAGQASTLYLLQADACANLDDTLAQASQWRARALSGPLPARRRLSLELRLTQSCWPYAAATASQTYPLLLLNYRDTQRDEIRSFASCLTNLADPT
ncbi:prepilin-type N-terminal cleavage/methylation domain-containing protein [Chromobacterium sp.]|uniref:prepilin-type N-terminal cleavage/methylation domain-containing protein n=1 Tax=Chromobacterium sp. TaxID=306190 RepID=UPI0035B0F29C